MEKAHKMLDVMSHHDKKIRHVISDPLLYTLSLSLFVFIHIFSRKKQHFETYRKVLWDFEDPKLLIQS